MKSWKCKYWSLSLLLIALNFVSVAAYAERISLETANRVAATALKQFVPKSKSYFDLDLIYAAKSQSPLTKSAGEVDYYIFNLSNGGGFVIVAGDDRVEPVLAYSTEGNFVMKDIPENIQYWLDGYQESINYAIQQDAEPSAAVKAAWDAYLNDEVKTTGKEVVLETAKWDQGHPYNKLCPIIKGKRALTGCVATAIAIVMKYNKWPDIAHNGVTSYDGRSVKYEKYDWDNLPMEFSALSYTKEQEKGISQLMWNIGANVNMQYGNMDEGGSGAYSSEIPEPLINVFKYSKRTSYYARNLFSEKEWSDMLKKELDGNHPIYYSGSSSKGGHAFVCDGYKDDLFHFNWGWGGANNGFFLLTDMDPSGRGDGYSQGQGCVVVNKPVEGEDFIKQLSLFGDLQSPKPEVGKPFDVKVEFLNTGNVTLTNINYGIALVNVSDYSVKKTLFESQEALSHLKPQYGHFAESAINITNITLDKQLEKNEYLMLVFKADGVDKWIPVRSTIFKDRIGKNGPQFEEGKETPEEKTYAVTSELVNVFSDDLPKEIKEGETLSGTLYVKDNYSLPEGITVKMGDKQLSDSDYDYDKTTGKLSVPNVKADIFIKAEGVKLEVANETISHCETLFTINDGKLLISSPYKIKVSIYSISGACVYKASSIDHAELILPKGVYLLILDDKTFKVLL